MSALEVRPIRGNEVDAVLDMLAPWESRAFFERYFTEDPAFEPGHVCAAFDGQRPVSCAQIVPKRVHVVNGTANVAGIGQVWTEPEYRRRGIAQDVLRECLRVMRDERFALSVLFASRTEFYSALGWLPYPRTRTAVTAWPDGLAPNQVRPFDVRKDMENVQDLYAAYASAVPGTVSRDAAYWRMSLRIAGEPDERFLVATDESGRLRAYMRGTDMDGAYTITEYCVSEGSEAFAGALLSAHGNQAGDAGFMMLDLAHNRAFRAHLEISGFTLSDVELPFDFWRVIDASALPQPAAQPGSQAEELALLHRLLPPERYTYWLSDRF